ncbi:MAG: hypothetical protein E7647_06325 [Ruminococcaceae bacterium]|nr:hypothetical protein [Oscillospiraceae bacterium]
MKRALALALALLASAALIFGAALIRPSENTAEGKYRLSMGTAVTLAADEAKSSVTTVAVITDWNGVIVDCVIDCGDFAMSFDDAKAGKSGIYETKNERGDAYGMVAYGGATAEWYEQAEFFANYVKGMDAKKATLLDLSDGGKAGDADLSAGCTIAIGDFKKALVNAMGDTLAVSFDSEETPVLSLAMINHDAVTEAEGAYSVTMTTDLCAVASLDKKVLAAVTDVAEAKLSFGEDGTFASGSYSGTKREKLDSYGMVAYAGATHEWYEQADNFCKFIKGMTAEEIAAIKTDDTGKATDADLTAGCTIAVGDFIKIAEKALGAK